VSVDRFETLLQQMESRALPPVHQWQPEREGSIDIHIDAQGNWFHEGSKFSRQSLIDLFATILRREGSDYFLVTPAEKLKIRVDDVPFLVVDMEVRGTARQADLIFSTNVGDHVLADAVHELSMRADKPYLMVRDGLEAKLTRSVFYRLVEQGIEETGTLAVYSQGTRFSLGATE